MNGAHESAVDPASPLDSRLRRLLAADQPADRRRLLLLSLALVIAVGSIDFLVGFEFPLLVFYILPVSVAVVVSWRFAIAIAIASIATWVAGDFAAGASFPKHAIVFWNAFMALGTYLIVIWMFNRVLTLQRNMEERVRQRTLALTQLVAERERLEKAILEVTERERRAIGQDLHDGLGQHLTGTALAGHVLADKLKVKGLPEEGDAQRIVELVEDGIEKTRRLARGLLLAEIDPEGLVGALQDFAGASAEQFHIQCDFHCDATAVRFQAKDVATHLLRIAQEAVRNAVRHGRAKRIDIRLTTTESVVLTIRDFGTGIGTPTGDGLGLSIMAHRAEIIGGNFSIAKDPSGGTVVTCRLPLTSLRYD